MNSPKKAPPKMPRKNFQPGKKYPLPKSVATIIAELHAQVGELQKLAAKHAPNLKFTLDGRLVGDIGEIIAAMELKIAIQNTQQTGHDGIDEEGRRVEIKTTFKDSFAFRKIAERLICIKLHGSTHWEIIYDGSGQHIANLFAADAFQEKNPKVTRQSPASLKSQRQLSIPKLAALTLPTDH